VDSVKSVALLCWVFLAPCLPSELDRVDLRGDRAALVESSLPSLRDLVAETVRSVVLLLATRLEDSTAFETVFSPATFRACFVSCALRSDHK